MENKNRENLFEVLDPCGFEDWYFARWFVKSNLQKEPYKTFFNPEGGINHSVIVKGLSRHAIAVVRQIALLSHYPDYNEETWKNGTRFYFVVDDTAKAHRYLQEAPFFKNLYTYCNDPRHSYLDIRINLLDTDRGLPEDSIILDSVVIDRMFDSFTVDEGGKGLSVNIKRARRANMVYNIGELLDNLPPEDKTKVKSYAPALYQFSHSILPSIERKTWKNINDVRLKLSSLFCADNLERFEIIDFDKMGDVANLREYVEINISELSRCEHARWNVEKLILDYRPYTDEEMFDWITRFDDRKDNFRKQKKDKDYIHCDICSYSDLKRIRPDDMKYDTFLQLAMPEILKIKVK